MEAVHIIIIVITNENDGRRLLGTTLLKREKREDLSYLREETCLGGTKQYRSTHRHTDTWTRRMEKGPCRPLPSASLR
jgi:hypothetical protein